jgi:hypothetical protein
MERDICKDGRLDPSAIGWSPHPIYHLDLEPVRSRDLELELGVAKASLHWRFGRYTGWIVADDGTRADVDRMPGWLEHVDARW